MQSVKDEYIYAIDQEIFSFLIFNDFFMRGEFKCTSEVTKRIQIKNFKFSTRGFETLYQDVKMYLDRIATSSSYSTVRVSELLNRYIKLNTPETIRKAITTQGTNHVSDLQHQCWKYPLYR